MSGLSEDLRVEILLVCTGNVCRSPMAEGLLRQRIRDLGLHDRVHVSSAGCVGLDGQPPSGHAIEVLRSWGIDISGHVARSISTQDIQTADLILVMQEQHRRSVFGRVPSALSKTFLLSEMAGESADVFDPYGQSKTVYVACAEELERLISLGMERILHRIGIVV